MDPADVGEQIVREAAGEALHWTVIWDRALRAGLIDVRVNPDARDLLIRGLSQRARAGAIEKVAPGTYRAAGSPFSPSEDPAR